MSEKIKIGKKGKVSISWKINPTDYSPEVVKDIITKFSKKYGLPASSISVEPTFKNVGVNAVPLNADISTKILDPLFQQNLFKQYIEENHIEDCDFDEILKIDSQINALINYDKYEKGKRYEIKWLKWSNFLSYGKDNYFDFTTLKGLVLLCGEPANKSGKSTFAYDLLHFLLFGKTKSGKATVLAEMFNNYLPDENEVVIEGCINVDGEDYVIKRTLTRPEKSKKAKPTATQKVEYYRLYANGYEEALVDSDNLQEESSTKTSKVIKEAIGNEEDFDLIISANAKDLDDLISLKDTDRGRLLSRWIGLSCLEDKDTLAREKWNKEISCGRCCDMYNRETLKNEIDELTSEIAKSESIIESETKKVSESQKRIDDNNLTRDTLLSSKKNIDASLCNVDLTSLNNEIDNIINTGKNKKAARETAIAELNTFGEINIDETEFRSISSEKDSLIEKISDIKSEINLLRRENEALEKAEYCPTCKRKFDNIDNTELINKNNEKVNSLIEDGKKNNARKEELVNRINEINILREKEKEKNKAELKVSALNTEILALQNLYKEKKLLKDNREAYTAAIIENNKIDATIRVLDENIKVDKEIIRVCNENIFSNKSQITIYNNNILEKKNFIAKINEEIKKERQWKIYLQLIGKDGISKLVLRNTLPIINCELHNLLNDVSDFEVEVTVNQKNEVDFWLIRDDVKTKLAGASGLERTQAALALRVVLGEMCNLSKPPFILLDEVLGTVAKENYDDMKKLYDKIVKKYSFVLHICHIDLDWHDQTIVVQKVNNISSIKSIS